MELDWQLPTAFPYFDEKAYVTEHYYQQQQQQKFQTEVLASNHTMVRM